MTETDTTQAARLTHAVYTDACGKEETCRSQSESKCRPGIFCC